MFIIGDIHGQFRDYEYGLKKLNLSATRSEEDSWGLYVPRTDLRGFDCSIQIGDFGLFDHYDLADVEEMPNHKFIRGNHDNPELCRRHPNYLGDWGYLESQDIFFVGGGFSIDRDYRTPGFDWWEDEELSVQELQEVIDSYTEKKPRIMLSHECPTIVKSSLLSVNSLPITSRTERALQAMFDAHQPEIWLHGHYHVFKTQIIDETLFVSLKDVAWGQWKHCYFEIPGTF